MATIDGRLTDVVCWTRMQAEAGQDIQSIVSRKERERSAGEGLFFWGVGNAPSRAIGQLAFDREDVDVVFSLMKSRPRSRDVAPDCIVVWQTYIDASSIERTIPPNVLVTSKTSCGLEARKRHYALMCWSATRLQLSNQGIFDPAAYRNISELGGRIGSSQVTAMVTRTEVESQNSDYQINLRAKLVGSYWVRLGQPKVLSDLSRKMLAEASSLGTHLSNREWLDTVSAVRGLSCACTSAARSNWHRAEVIREQ